VFTDDSCVTPTCQPSLLETLDGNDVSTVFAANDDDASCLKDGTDGTLIGTGASTVVWDSIEGNAYHLYVSSKYDREDGIFGIKAISMAGPPNDQCIDAIELPTNGIEITGTTVNATIDGEFDSCYFRYFDSIMNIRGSSVWYTVVGTGQRIIVTTCSAQTNLDTVMAVYADDSCASDCQVSVARFDTNDLAASDNDESCTLTSSGASTVMWDSEEGQSYKLCVSNKDKRQDGTFGIKATSMVPPINDKCDNPTALATDGIEVIGTTVGATIDSGFDSCAFRPYGSEQKIEAASVWYVVEGTGGRISVTTCSAQTSLDTVIAVYTDESCGNDECQPMLRDTVDGELAANDDDESCTKMDSTEGMLKATGASTVSWDSVLGQKYKLYVSNKESRSDGTFGIRATSSG